jgi:hypothetical protein
MTTKHLLSVDTNAKTIKGQKLGFLTGILYMAPAAQSGHQVCAMAALAGCEAACLYTAGHGAFSNVQQARIAKTVLYFEDRPAFMALLVKNIQALVKRAAKNGLTPLVRLNGTSDIKWENVPVTHEGITYDNVMAVFPALTFYDYTKHSNRSSLPSNYDLTFSYSGVLSYQKYVSIAVKAGMRIAVVFRTAASIPAKFLGMECIGGDDSDVRHSEPHGVVVALYAKGKAKKDMTGFVVDSGKPMFVLAA